MFVCARNRRLHVAHVVLQLQTGGMEKLLVEFARHADRARFDLSFIALGPGGQLAQDIEACGWPVTVLDTPPGLRPSLVLRLASVLRRVGADVVHTHNSKPLIYGAIASRLAGVRRLIHTRHGQRYQASRGATGLFRLAASLASEIVAVSEDGARLSIDEGISPAKVTTIWNGIDADRFAYRGPCPGGPAVMVGRLSPEKDVATLLRASRFVADASPMFRLELAGDGVCRPQLERLVNELKLREHVRFLGEVRNVPELLSRASLFVLPSLTEGVSLTLLEAMARGLPVVATRVGGNAEVVVEAETGLLVPAGSPEELAAAMLRIWNDPERGRSLGEAGRQRVERCFDVRRMVADYERLYTLGKSVPNRAVEPAALPVCSAEVC